MTVSENNFDAYKKIIEDNKPEEEVEIDKFIKVCDVKIERAKILMSDVGTVLNASIAVIATAIVLSGVIQENYFKYSFLVSVFISIFIIALFFIALRAHYRFHIHAWTTFKEAAILSKEHIETSSPPKSSKYPKKRAQLSRTDSTK